MSNVFKNLFGLFGSFFKLIEEIKQTSVINSIGKDEESNIVVFLSPIGGKENLQIYPDQIINKPFIKKQLRNHDIKLLESIIISEGDIFIEAKEYKGNEEFYTLKSTLNQETWTLTESEIINNKEIYSRLNKRFFSKKLNPKPLITN